MSRFSCPSVVLAARVQRPLNLLVPRIFSVHAHRVRAPRHFIVAIPQLVSVSASYSQGIFWCIPGFQAIRASFYTQRIRPGVGGARASKSLPTIQSASIFCIHQLLLMASRIVTVRQSGFREALRVFVVGWCRRIVSVSQ